jgi:hypothetical protein
MKRRSLSISALALTAALAIAFVVSGAFSLRAQDAAPTRPELFKGFSTTLEDGVAVVGVRVPAAVRVAQGPLTLERMDALKEKVHGPFLAYSEGGHDYLITDPGIVQKAFEIYPIPDRSDAALQARAQHPELETLHAHMVKQTLRALIDQSKATGKSTLITD